MIKVVIKQKLKIKDILIISILIMLNILDSWSILYIPLSGLSGWCLHHALCYNESQSIFDYKLYINTGTVVGLSIGIARYYASKPLLFYITMF